MREFRQCDGGATTRAPGHGSQHACAQDSGETRHGFCDDGDAMFLSVPRDGRLATHNEKCNAHHDHHRVHQHRRPLEALALLEEDCWGGDAGRELVSRRCEQASECEKWRRAGWRASVCCRLPRLVAPGFATRGSSGSGKGTGWRLCVSSARSLPAAFALTSSLTIGQMLCTSCTSSK